VRKKVGLIQIKMIFLRKGQNLTEVMLIIGVLGLALIGMQVYVKRGLQGKMKDLTDKIISDKQEPYPQDTSGLTTNIATTTLSSDSSTIAKESQDGARSLREVETKTYFSTSATIGN
jgi:hypothetical protein